MAHQMPKRLLESYTADAERKVLTVICARLPGWVTPNGLTLFGLAGAVMIFCGFILASTSVFYLLLGIVGLVVNWLGDSLDGSLARYRKIERPRFGSFIDSSADMVVAVLIFVGLGLSPWVRFEIALVMLIQYFLFTVFSHLKSLLTGIYQISFDGMGPTEGRLALIVLIIAMMLLPPSIIVTWFGGLTALDLVLIVYALAVFASLGNLVIKLGRVLANDEIVLAPVPSGDSSD